MYPNFVPVYYLPASPHNISRRATIMVMRCHISCKN